ncbi:MAG: flavodoxin family protein [Lentisphaeria bacterium]|nr:flavodoxin family protein [Lentisphaeria bacterium]
MKKIYAVNGSPRKNGNTAKILAEALKGAQSMGAETQLINLSDLNFSGCKSCFACKLKNSPKAGRCALQDDLSPILEEIINSDGLIMGSPIYFSAETGLYRNFLERLFFPLLQYTNPASSLAPKKVEVSFVFTMNVPAEVMNDYGYTDYLEKTLRFPKLIFGSEKTEVLYVNDTYQFNDYSKYESSMFDAEHKAKMRDKKFPQDLKKAFELGKNLVG